MDHIPQAGGVQTLQYRRSRHRVTPTVFASEVPDGATGRIMLCRSGRLNRAGWAEITDRLTAAGYIVNRHDTGGARFISGTDPDGGRFRIIEAGAWFGDDLSADVVACQRSWNTLQSMLTPAAEGMPLLDTPSATGREMIRRIMAVDAVWPVQSGEVLDVMHDSGQGRFEMFTPADGVHVPDLYAYDMRLAYGALLRTLPVGEPDVRGGGDIVPYSTGRYLMSWTAPAGWDHVGILPERSEAGWLYPLRGRGWCDAVEVELAAVHGWSVTIEDRMLWTGRGRVLERWQEILLRLRDKAAGLGDDAQSERVRAALRSIIVQTIGSWWSAERRVMHEGTTRDADLTGAVSVRRLGKGRLQWFTIERPDPTVWTRPEWASTVWARCRARLLSGPGQTGALFVSPASLVGFRADAVWLSVDPVWPDSGRVGGWRFAGHVQDVTVTGHGSLIAAGRAGVELLEADNG